MAKHADAKSREYLFSRLSNIKFFSFFIIIIIIFFTYLLNKNLYKLASKPAHWQLAS